LPVVAREPPKASWAQLLCPSTELLAQPAAVPATRGGDRIMGKGLAMSTGLDFRRPGGGKNDFYVLGDVSEDGPRVLCVASIPGIKTLPLFSDREAARRFLRATPLRFGLLGCGWRPRRILQSELGSLFLRLPAGIRQIALDLSPEVLVGECSAEPLSEVA
jgi:hypothetical protein